MLYEKFVGTHYCTILYVKGDENFDAARELADDLLARRATIIERLDAARVTGASETSEDIEEELAAVDNLVLANPNALALARERDEAPPC